MKILQYLPLQIMVLYVYNTMFVQGINSFHSVSTKKDVSSPIVNYSEDKKIILQNQLKRMILQHNSRDLLNRKLAEGDWDFINDFFEDFEIEVPIDQTQTFNGIEFTVGTATCGEFGISDIEANGSGNDKKYDISLLVSGLTMKCDIDYSYKGGFFVGSGSGIMTITLTNQSSIELILSFESESFLILPPVEVSSTCSADLDVDVTFDNLFFNFLSGAITPVVESTMEPAVCEAFSVFDDILTETLFSFNEGLKSILVPLGPEVLDPLYPELSLFNTTLGSSTLNYLPLQPFLGIAKGPLTILLKKFIADIFNEDGDIELPVVMPGITNGTDVISMKVNGLNEFIIDNVTLLSTYTIGSSFVIPKLGLEIELGVTNEDNSQDIILVTVELEDLVFDFGLLVVIEQSLAFEEYTSGFNGIFECIEESLSAFEITGMSLRSGTYKGATVEGDVGSGPVELAIELTDAFTFIFSSTLTEVTSYIFELFIRESLNGAIAMSFGTCAELLFGRTTYVPAFSACWRIELFEGGTLSADYSDPGCLNDIYDASPSLSVFENITTSGASFTPGTLGWTGQMEFKEDPSKSMVELLPVIDPGAKLFNITMTFPTCKTPCTP